MLFWTLAAHGRLDQEPQSKDSRSMHRIMALRRNSAVVTHLLCSPTPRQKPARKSCIIYFPTIPPCSTMVDVLDTGGVPILFSLSQMKNLGTTVELDPKGIKITCPAFGLYSSPAEHSTTGHIVLDLTNLAYQPTTKSREQSGHPERHVTFAMSERRPAYPAHAPDMDEDKDEDDKPLVRPAPVRKRKDPLHRSPPLSQYGRTQLLHGNTRYKRLARASKKYLNFWQKSRR